MIPTTWIVVADAARAHIFSLTGHPKKLKSIREMAHPDSRKHAREGLTSDRPGRSFESFGNMRHAMTQPVEPKRVEKRKFGLEVVHALDMARKEGLVSRLVIVAGPGFLGELRSHMSRQTADIVDREIPKDLVGIPMNDLPGHLPDDLFEEDVER